MSGHEPKKPLQKLIRDFNESKEPLLELLQFVKPYRARFVLGIVCGAIFGFINGIVMLIIYFVGKVVFNGASEFNFAASIPNLGPLNKSVQYLAVQILHLDHVSKLESVIAACLVIPVVMMMRSVVDYLSSYLGIWVGNKVLIDIRSRVIAHISRQSLDFFNEARAGNLIQTVFQETQAMQGIFFMLSQQVSAPVTLITGVAVLLKLNWMFTIGALVLFPSTIVPVIKLGKKIREAAHREHLQRGDMMVILHEIISGIKVVKAFSRSRYETDRFNAASHEQFREMMRVQRTIETISPVVETLAAFGIGLGITYAYLTKMDGTMLFALCGGIFMLYQPTKSLSKTHLNLVRCLAVARNVFALMRRKPTVQDAPDAMVLNDCKGEIVFDKVSFGYRKDILAVKDISIRLEQGKYYALVGLSGSGKSTMLSLILRFYDPLAGAILIDGHDLRALKQDSLRRQIGMVTQETFLFHETIFKNIAYGRQNATREEVIAAAKQAYAHDFIMAQQDGYETIVGDRGCQLSGGQQQRLAIARALLKNAPILLLDEATSALDSESEKQIQAALDILAKGRTVIAIAHRLSTILKADQILVMDGGHVVEKGTSSELLKKDGHYRRLHDLQFNQHDSVSDETTASDGKMLMTEALNIPV